MCIVDTVDPDQHGLPNSRLCLHGMPPNVETAMLTFTVLLLLVHMCVHVSSAKNYF